MAELKRKCLIMYFSMKGSTARTAEAVSSGLQNTGYHVDLFNLLHQTPPDPLKYDLLGVGTPVYYYRTPFPVNEYMKKLPRPAGLPAEAVPEQPDFCQIYLFQNVSC